MQILLKNGWLLDKEHLISGDVLIEDSSVVAIGRDISTNHATVIDVTGKVVIPGLVDLHVHLREPGGEQKETVATGTLAAARGGFTTVAAMPNTTPVPDSVERVSEIRSLVESQANVRVLLYASLTMGRAGSQLTDFAVLADAGIVGFSDDGSGIQDAGLMYQAMARIAAVGKPLAAHCEDDSLVFGGAIHHGQLAERLGLQGIPSVAESVQVARDILLAEATGAHYHVCHVSTKESVWALRAAKDRGVRVTAEVSPHHLLLCEDDINELGLDLDPNFKMNPPLRSREDRAALLQGLKDGTIDFIATDHAPHTLAEKAQGMETAPFGIVGLETAFPLLYTYLVQKGEISLSELVKLLTVNPCNAFGLPYGRLEVGGAADITVIDLDTSLDIDPDEFLSRGKNTPFSGWNCQGWPVLTVAGGTVVWQKGRGAV